MQPPPILSAFIKDTLFPLAPNQRELCFGRKQVTFCYPCLVTISKLNPPKQWGQTNEILSAPLQREGIHSLSGRTLSLLPPKPKRSLWAPAPTKMQKEDTFDIGRIQILQTPPPLLRLVLHGFTRFKSPTACILYCVTVNC